MRILLLDLDGTIRRPKNGSQFITHPLDQEPIPGAVLAMQGFERRGWTQIGVTNQAGVAAGYKSLEECIEEQKYSLDLFPLLREIYFSPDFEGKSCYRIRRDRNPEKLQRSLLGGSFRKPGAEIYRAILVEFEFEEIWDTWMLGDRPEDKGFAENAGINFCPAEAWRSRFLPGFQELKGLSQEQVAFLESF